MYGCYRFSKSRVKNIVTNRNTSDDLFHDRPSPPLTFSARPSPRPVKLSAS